MNVGVTSATLASVVSLTAAVAILLRRPRRPLYAYFAAFAIALFLWHLASLASRFTGESMTALQGFAALSIPPTAVLFYREFMRVERAAWRHAAQLTLLASAVLALANASPWRKLWLLKLVIVGYVAAALIFVARELYRRAQQSHSEADRKRLRLLFGGGVGTMCLAGFELLPHAGLLAAFGHLAVTFYVYFLYQSIVARRLIDLVELLGKAAVLSVLTLVLATVYSLLVLWVGADQQGMWLFNTLVASFVILILYDQVRPWVENATARLLFQRTYELRRAVPRLLRELRTTIDIADMCDRTLDALHASGHAENVAIYLPDDGEMTFRLVGCRGALPPRIVSVSQQPSLFNMLRRERAPVLLEHLQHRHADNPDQLTADNAVWQREMQRLQEAMASLRQLHASVVLPMLVEDKMVGLLTLGHAKGAAPLATQEIAALMSVAEACAVVIENSQEYERNRQRDRLAAIGEMATGMAHEIRNPLGAIKGAAQCLDPARMPAEAREFLQVILEEVDRLNGVVAQFLEYARPFKGTPEPTNVNDVIAATVRLMEHQRPANVTIESDLTHDLPAVSMDPERLKQVLLNLFMNGAEAMPNGGQLLISTLVTHEHQGDTTGEVERCVLRSFVSIRIQDTGSGIAPEDLPRIFVPFFTTKPHGTGLGLAITQRIVETAGGRIEVTSNRSDGTTFTLRFPALTAHDSAHTHEPAVMH